jgi:hypothetical protein
VTDPNGVRIELAEEGPDRGAQKSVRALEIV